MAALEGSRDLDREKVAQPHSPAGTVTMHNTMRSPHEQIEVFDNLAIHGTRASDGKVRRSLSIERTELAQFGSTEASNALQ